MKLSGNYKITTKRFPRNHLNQDLKRKIKEAPNYHFLEWTTREFLEFLHANIREPKELKKELIKNRFNLKDKILGV